MHAENEASPVKYGQLGVHVRNALTGSCIKVLNALPCASMLITTMSPQPNYELHTCFSKERKMNAHVQNQDVAFGGSPLGSFLDPMTWQDTGMRSVATKKAAHKANTTSPADLAHGEAFTCSILKVESSKKQ